jgi:hypothetical protein
MDVEQRNVKIAMITGGRYSKQNGRRYLSVIIMIMIRRAHAQALLRFYSGMLRLGSGVLTLCSG